MESASLQIEEAALKKEDDRLSKERLATLQKELADLKDEYNSIKAQWENEKSRVDNLSKLREEIDSVSSEIQIAQQNGDLNRAAELQYGRLPQLKKELAQSEEAMHAGGDQLVHDRVTDNEISRIVSRWTGIPVSKLTESERSKTLHLGDELHRRVIGQDEAVQAVVDDIQRNFQGRLTSRNYGIRGAENERVLDFDTKKTDVYLSGKKISIFCF